MTAPRAGPSIIVATRNRHKLAELAEILTDHDLLPLPESVELPPEEGETFVDNALGKARAAHAATGSAVIADDSGIAAAALGGLPGVHSARYAGPAATDAENLQLLLDQLSGRVDRSVAYVCAIVHISAEGTETVREERCEGTLALRPRGDGGFGYDPAFLPAEIADGRTMAELTPEEKHAISHRGRAASEIAAAIADDGSRR